MDDGPRTLGDLLARGRAQRVVGRDAEQAVFRDILAGDSSSRLLWVHGPGGVGKTTLLRAFEAIALGTGTRSHRLDLKALEPRPDAFLEGLRADGWDPRGGRAVVMVDTFERAGALERWFRDAWLPGLTADAVVVVAGRRPPADEWHDDEGWRSLLRRIHLRNLTPEQTRTFLDLAGVAAADRDALAAITHGHPLALSLAAELARGGTTLTRLDETPDLVEELVHRLVESVPDALHRRALHTCAHAWITTEDLMRDVLGLDDAHDVMAWLRGLSLVEEGPYGVAPHDLARDVVDSDLRRRDPVAYAELHRRVQRSSIERARRLTGADQQRAIMQIVHAHRNSAIAAFWEYAELGAAYADALRTEDVEAVLEFARRHQGPEQAELVAYWIERQPEGFRVVRTGGPEPVGFAAVLRLDFADEDDRERDPAVRAVTQAIDRHRPLRPGDHATLMRFFVDAERNQAPSATLNLGPVLTFQVLLADAAIAWDVLCWIDSGAMDPLMEFIDYQRLAGAEHRIGGTPYAAFGHDFRRRLFPEWLDLLGNRELGEPVRPPRSGSDEPVALSYAEFGSRVREALRDLSRRDRLARNPLCRSRLVAGADDPTAELERAVRAAIAELAGHPREARLARALDRTYLHGAPTQEAAAEVLGLPFSTYRRHLTQGVERLVEKLWQAEIGGRK